MTAPRRRRRSLLGKVIIGVSAAIILFNLVILIPVAMLYRGELINARVSKLDLIASEVIEHSRVDAAADRSDLLEAVEQAARDFDAQLDGAQVRVVDAEGVAISLTEDARTRVTDVATQLMHTHSGLSRIEASVSTVDGRWLVHLTPIRSRTGFVEGALLLDAPLGTIDRRVATHVLLGMGLLPLLLLFTGGVMIWVLHKHVLRPIAAITQANRAIVDGEVERAIVPEEAITDDELGEVIRVRNEIYEKLLRYQTALRESNRVLENQREELKRWNEELERRVREKSARLEQALERLLSSEKQAATGRLAAGIAHELNNPLASIRGYAEDLRELARSRGLEELDVFEEFPDSLRIIEEQADRCKRIIKKLMSYASPVPYAPEVVPLGPLVEGVLPLIEHKARGRDVAVILDLDPEVGPARADRANLEQVLVNLLVNAFDVIEGNTGQITVATHEAPPRSVAIAVRDTGPGIPERNRRRIFDPFFTTKPMGLGTGLGLSICHTLIERMGGQIEVTSSPRGTTFTVTLPRATPSGKVLAASSGAVGLVGGGSDR